MIVWGGADLARRWQWRAVTISVTGAAILICTLLTWKQIRYWHESVTLFRHALAVDDANSVAHIQLAGSLCNLGHTATGRPSVRHCLARGLDPLSPLPSARRGRPGPS